MKYEEVVKLIEGSRLSEAEALAERAVATYPTDPAWHYLQAEIFHAQGKTAEAKASILRVLQLAPDSAASWNKLGLLLEEMHDMPEARKAFEQAVRHDPNLFAPRLNLGVRLFAEGQVDAAMTQMRTALALEPSNFEAHEQLGLMLVRKEKFEEAEQQWREAIRLAPEKATPYFNLGGIRVRRKEWKEAEEFLREAVRRDPQNAEFRTRLRSVMAIADHLVYHFTRWSHTVVELPGHSPQDFVRFDGYEVPVLSVRDRDEYQEACSLLRQASSPQFPVLFRGQSRTWILEGETSLTPAGFRQQRDAEKLVAAVDQ